MRKTMRAATARRTLGALLTLVAVAVSTLVTSAPAQAQGQPPFEITIYFNGFEGSDANVWGARTTPAGPGNVAGIERNSPNPFEGLNNGAMLARDLGSAALYRQMSIGPNHAGRTCYWTAFVQATDGSYIIMTVEDTDTGQVLSQEVHQFPVVTPPPTATNGYWPVSTGFLVTRNSWQRVEASVTLLAPSGHNQNAWARVDNTHIRCRW